jgi:hypothetical protein
MSEKIGNDPTEPNNLPENKDLIKIMSNAAKDENKNKQLKDAKSVKDNGDTKKKKKKSKSKKTTASVTFYYILACSAIALAIGCVWTIKDVFFGEDIFEQFLTLDTGLQLVIVGVLGLIFFILVISAWSMFRKGNRFVYNLLYPDIERAKVPKENTPAKVITAGLLVSVFIISAGLVVGLISSLFSVEDDLIVFFATLSGGMKIVLISLIIFVMTLLIISFVWIWENGYNSVLNKVIKYNKPQDGRVFSKKQVIVSTIVYVITMICLIALAFGTLWAVLDAISPTGKWEAFVALSITWKITIIGALSSMLFGLIILGLIFFKRGRDSIERIIYKKSKSLEALQPSKSDKIMTIGVIIFILLVLVGALIYALSNLSTGGGSTSFIELILSLPNGLKIVVLTAFVLGATWLIVL